MLKILCTRISLPILATLVACCGIAPAAKPAAKIELRSLSPDEVPSKLDLSGPGLEAARKASEASDRIGALGALVDYYRRKYPLPAQPAEADRETIAAADAITRHILQWGPYESADYGKDIDWAWDPRGDIEWVAAVYRFFWAAPLAEAYSATRDDKYVKAFVELASDWIRKHPLEQRRRTHPVYTSWRGYAWLDIQTGIRAENICAAFPALVHGESFSPEFLGVLLASLYDHQVKTEHEPMNQIHNKAVFEQRGFVDVATTFPEFRESRRWMELALERTRENFLAQVTTDGVQREWSFGYHLGVLRDAADIMRRMETFGIRVPDDYRQRVRRMCDYVFAVAGPDLGPPMFGDASRKTPASPNRRQGQLYATLVEATKVLGDPKYAALADLDLAKLPKETSIAFREAGLYVLRDQWGPEQIYLSLHCAPPAISSHDQPDNGTFELCAYGRWLMPDTGFYTYGHDAEGRKWHRQTRVHQTLTLDNKDSRVDARQLVWKTSPAQDVLAVENRSYENLTHRRTVWFVQKRFFVLLDEAIGARPGELALHFQLAPGDAQINAQEHWAATTFPDANVLVWMDPQAPVTMEEEEGWFAWSYGHRVPRKAFCYRHANPAPATFLTVIYPYRGAARPEVSARLVQGIEAGADRVEVEVNASGKAWRLARDLR